MENHCMYCILFSQAFHDNWSWSIRIIVDGLGNLSQNRIRKFAMLIYFTTFFVISMSRLGSTQDLISILYKFYKCLVKLYFKAFRRLSKVLKQIKFKDFQVFDSVLFSYCCLKSPVSWRGHKETLHWYYNVFIYVSRELIYKLLECLVTYQFFR